MTPKDHKGLELRLHELRRIVPASNKDRADIERNIAYVEKALRGDDLDQLAEQAQEMGMGYQTTTVCPGCNQEIDPDVCGCGDSRQGHSSARDAGHPFIPAGCNCYRARSH